MTQARSTRKKTNPAPVLRIGFGRTEVVVEFCLRCCSVIVMYPRDPLERVQVCLRSARGKKSREATSTVC